jgi:hypothetical protein
MACDDDCVIMLNLNRPAAFRLQLLQTLCFIELSGGIPDDWRK